MNELANKTACVVDSNMNLSLAMHIGPAFRSDGFGRVLYHTAFAEDHQSLFKVSPGMGFELFGIERCDDFMLKLDEIDCFIFPDNGYLGTQIHLEALGKRVIGSRAGMRLEQYRSLFRDLQSDLKMDVPKFVEVKGVTALRKHLRDKEDKWLKIDRYRADFETTHWRSWKEDEVLLDKLAVKFGPFKEDVVFHVEDGIPTEIEIGGDFFIVDGQTPSHAVTGAEKKNQSYLAFIREYADVPEAVRNVIDPILPTLKHIEYRNFLSTEQRVTPNKNYWIDFTSRLGFPSGSAQLQLYGNLPSLLWHGAVGETVPIEPAAKVCLEVLLEHFGNLSEPRTMEAPEEVMPYLNLIEAAMRDGVIIFPPNDSNSRCVGSVNGIGDSVAEAKKHLLHNWELISEQPLEARIDTLDELQEEVSEAESSGIQMIDESKK